jgi:hypothetical protein
MSPDTAVGCPALRTIDRRSGLSHGAFVSEYLLPQRPVILTDVIQHWKAIRTWSPQMFKDMFGAREVSIDGRTYTVAGLIDLVVNSSSDRPAPYLRNCPIDEWAPELLDDIMPLPGCTKPNWFESRLFPSRRSFTYLELYIGGRGASFPVLHYDSLHTHAFLMQVFGRKRFIVFSPDQSAYVYPGTRGGKSNSQVNDVEHVDLERFPLFAKTTPTEFVLEPGETLFVPAGWWHTTRMLTPSITISANTANTANWKAFCEDYVDNTRRHRSAVIAAGLKVYLALLGAVQPFVDLLG